MPVMDEPTPTYRAAPVAPGADGASGAPAATQLSRPQIMEATLRVLREEGYDATTIRRIAARLGCAVGSIYRYFQDKRDLLAAVAEAALEPAAQHVEAGGSLEDSAKLYHRLAAQDAALYQLTFWLASVIESNGDGDADAPRALPPIIDRLIRNWSKRLGDEPLATRCWTVLHGCVTLNLDAEQTLALVRSQVRHTMSAPSAVNTPREPGQRPNAPSSAMTPVILAAQPAFITKPVQTTAAQREAIAAHEAELQAVEDVVLL